ncbi:helix-turn-helix domain-containing protein [Paenibacillus sp. MBLB4367]|uniref:helix-turn-helix domain-containing protein n=1 Tax=Paenibacillus sp. MBLB4367 TaxID=3384767 RepID=UPI003908400C
MKTGKQVPDHVVHDVQELDVPLEFYQISEPKKEISLSIKRSLEKKRLSIRKLAEMTGMKHPQILRVTSGDTNYNLDTLLKILEALDLELVIRDKNK